MLNKNGMKTNTLADSVELGVVPMSATIAMLRFMARGMQSSSCRP